MDKITTFIKNYALVVVLGIGVIVALVVLGGALEGVDRALRPLGKYFETAQTVLGVVVIIVMTLSSGFLAVAAVIDIFKKKSKLAGILGICFYGAVFTFFAKTFWLKWVKNIF